MIIMLSGNRGNNINNFNYILNNAPALREAFLGKEFTRADYEQKFIKWENGRLCSTCLSLDTARSWGFVEVVREEPICRKMENIYITPYGARVCSEKEYAKMDPAVILTIEASLGKLSKVAVPVNSSMKRNIYRWNDEVYLNWIRANKQKINQQTEDEINILREKIDHLSMSFLM